MSNKKLIEFIEDHDVIKERLKNLIIKLRFKKTNHIQCHLTLFKQGLDSWCALSYVRIKYLLGEPL